MISSVLQRVTTDDRFVVLNGSYSLEIMNVTLEDEGNYLCTLYPRNITMTAKLVVLPKFEAHIYQNGRDANGRSITFPENVPFEVECSATGRVSSKIVYKWNVNGDPLEPNEHLIVDDGKLVFKKPSYKHINEYECLADDGSDSPAQATIKINIDCKSTHRHIYMFVQMSKIEILIGSPISFSSLLNIR